MAGRVTLSPRGRAVETHSRASVTQAYEIPTQEDNNMIELIDSSSHVGDAPALRERFHRDSYVLVRGLLPRAAVRQVHNQIVRTLDDAGWLTPGSDPDHPVASPAAIPESSS